MKILPTTTYYKKIPYSVVNYQSVPNFCGKNLLTKPIIDTCSFSHSDKTLEPKFLKHLLDIGNENISILQKYTKIKDEMLKTMGYKHPEELKIIPIQSQKDASYEASQGVIYISDQMKMPTAIIIATLRHELEHLDQFAKTYKSMGEKAFLEILTNFVKRLNPELKQSEINIKLNKRFYEIMSKDANTKNFDSEKYYNAMHEYIPFSYDASKAYIYYNNLLEKDAYSVERKILSSLGEEPVVSADGFTHNYKTLVKLMNDNKVQVKYQDNVLQVLRLAAQIKSLETADNFKKIWRIWVNKQKNIAVTAKEEELLNQSLNKVNEIYCSTHITLKQVELDKGCSNQIETWLRQGIWYFEDILKEA